MLRPVILALSLFLGFAGIAWGGEKIQVDQLPAEVSNTIKEKFPNAELLSAERDTDDGQVKYDVKLTSEGTRYEVEVAENGTLLEFERKGM